MNGFNSETNERVQLGHLHAEDETRIMADTYAARIVDVPGQGLRLAPTDDTAIPEQPNEMHLLALAIALALGAAGYEHHPEPRDPGVQTIEALLAGDAVMPWRSGSSRQAGNREGGGDCPPGMAAYVVCHRTHAGHPKCHVRCVPVVAS
jgi:hypothetical protein